MAHLLRRAGFGAPYEQVEAYAAKGYEATVEELLRPESQPSLDDDLLIRLNMGWQSLINRHQDLTFWIHKMINTRRPLEEKIALFWHSVLCTGLAKVDHHRQMANTIELLRRFGLGNVREILIRTARNPAMIYYLDNNTSHKGAINENWGRELLELFSMGVGNYTEDDVKEASRAFTGWSVGPSFPPYPYGRAASWEFLYDRTDHDSGDKIFLGQGGRLNGEDIMDIICRQPATSRFLARHLYNFFVADEPPVPQWGNTAPRDPQAIDILIGAYFDSEYDIRSMLRVLFNADFFKKASFAKVKSPTEVVVGAARLTKDFTFPSPNLIDLVRQCAYMGQELYDPPSVEGWHTGQEWIDSGTLVERVNFLSSQLGDYTKPGVKEVAQRLMIRGECLTPEEMVDGCAEQLGVRFGEETRRDLVEFARRDGPINTRTETFNIKTAALLGVMVATKEYQFN